MIFFSESKNFQEAKSILPEYEIQGGTGCMYLEINHTISTEAVDKLKDLGILQLTDTRFIMPMFDRSDENAALISYNNSIDFG